MTLNWLFMYAMFIHHCYSICLICTESWNMAYCLVSYVVWRSWFLTLSMFFTTDWLFANRTAWIRDIWHQSLLCLWSMGSMLLPLSNSLVVWTCFYFCFLLIYNFFGVASMGSQWWGYVHCASCMWVFLFLAFQLVWLWFS